MLQLERLNRVLFGKFYRANASPVPFKKLGCGEFKSTLPIMQRLIT
jgi:hypothetical protein